MIKSLLTTFFLALLLFANESYSADIKAEGFNTGESLKDDNREGKKNLKIFYSGYIAQFFLHFNNKNWSSTLIEKWGLNLNLYLGYIHFGLGLRINDYVLIRIIGLNVLGVMLTFLLDFFFIFQQQSSNNNSKKKDNQSIMEVGNIAGGKNSDDEEFGKENDILHEANKKKKKIYIERYLSLASLFDIVTIEIRLTTYWVFNLNFILPLIAIRHNKQKNK